MGKHSIQTLRADVRSYMKELARLGLGKVGGTKRRDVFVLDASHAGASALTAQAGKHKNFIRSEDGSLLFRDASSTFLTALDPALVRRRSLGSAKGLEFQWTQLDKPELKSLFTTVRQVAGG
jgi:hypothetical protein